MSLVKVVVVSDGLNFKIPGQKDPEPPKVYAVIPAQRGQEIEVDEADADRFLALGSVALPGTAAALLAKEVQHRWGPPAGAVRLEDGNQAVDRIVTEARQMGLVVNETTGSVDETDEGVSGAPEVDASSKEALNALSVAQLKGVAGRLNVEIGSKDKKSDLVDKLHAHATAAAA